MIGWWDIKNFEQVHNSIISTAPPPPVWYQSQYFSQFSSLSPLPRLVRAPRPVRWTSPFANPLRSPPSNVRLAACKHPHWSVADPAIVIHPRGFVPPHRHNSAPANPTLSTTKCAPKTLIVKPARTMYSLPTTSLKTSIASTNCASPVLLLFGTSTILVVPIAPMCVRATMHIFRTRTVVMPSVVRCQSLPSSALPAETLSSSIQCWISITNIQAVTGRTGLQQPQPPPLPHWPRETPPPDPRSSPRDPHRPPPARWVRATSLSIGNLCGRWPLRSSLEPFWTWSHPTQTIKLNLFYLDPVYLVSCPTARK